ncbi:restriction endonuclease subunit S [Micromonospora sp. DT47]|uniref:restriction endonuclease subunit S n=1 Tax=Micromonospora sp. DT47 TaxID=3393431 RepID=UPI003CED00CF
MKDWRFAQLGDLCTITAGGTPSRSNPGYFSGDIPWVKISDMLQGRVVSTEESITELALKNSTAKLLPAGTVLISIFATIGRTAVLGVDATTNQAIAGITPRDPEVLSPLYLRRYLDSVVSTLERKARGAAQVNINSTILKSLPIPVPSQAEQQKVVEALDRADELRAKRREALARLDDLTQSIFLDMFGHPVRNPRAWPMARIEDVADVQGGLQLSGSRSRHPIEVPYLRVANVHRGRLDLTEIKTLRASEAEVSRTSLRDQDLLIVEGHGNPEEIGRAALWDGSVSPCVHQNHLIRARFNPASIVPVFASYYVNSPGGRRHLLRAGKTTSGLNTISVADVRSTPIATPPLDLQHTFARRVANVEVLKAAHRGSLAELDGLFASVQDRAFRGLL